MRELIQLFTQIALLRKGPQDLPASVLLLAVTVVGYFVVNFVVSALMPPITGWPAHLAVDVGFTLLWYVLLMRLAGKSERTLQTTTAVFGFQAVLSPLLVVSEWLMRRFAQDATWQFPVTLIGLVLIIWVIAANSHVVKAALEWSSPASVALVILQILAGQVLLFALFPPAREVTPAMHVHILGISGTFMGGIAAIARAAGHRVTGSDRNVYPPMSTQLESLGIDVIQGFEAEQLDPAPDIVVVGNVMTRGQQVVEALLERGLPYASGPEWLSREVLKDRWVLAVAGTHGKTTTSSLLAWILEHAGLAPGFLIGGVPANFDTSARLGREPFFVIEADEYDTAFFDKRAKFVHYRPRTAILNNLEYDHADIYPDVASIQRQFHHLVRIVPGGGRIVWNAGDARLQETLAMGCWTPLEGFSRTGGKDVLWSARAVGAVDDYSKFEVLEAGKPRGTVQWSLIGAHNMENALAAIAAARHAGVTVEHAIDALQSFQGIARRMQVRGEVNGVRVYDDFAHHPTAIATTVDGLRRRVGKARIIAVLEPRSNTMRMGVHQETLAASLADADEVWLHTPADIGWNARAVVAALGARGHASHDIDALAAELAQAARSGDHVLIMSNGGFGGLHGKLLAQLERRTSQEETRGD